MAGNPLANFEVHARQVNDPAAAAALDCLRQMIEIQHNQIEDLQRQLEQLRNDNQAGPPFPLT